MTLESAARWARRNWISCLLLGAIAAALAWEPGGSGSPAAPSGPAGVTEAPPVDEGPVQAEQEALKQALDDAIYRNLVRERERLTAQTEIDTHLEELLANPEPYDEATRLCALGNLYQQEHQDYERAAGYYLELIDTYPDWPGIATAYHQLVACYKHLKDPQRLRLLYRTMVEVFPEGTPEHDYARSALESSG